MPFATAISLVLTLYLRETLLNVSPEPTVWTGGVGNRVCAELPTKDVEVGIAGAGTGAAGAEGAWGIAADIGMRGAAAWAIFAPPPAPALKSGADAGAGGAYADTGAGGAYCEAVGA
jgi:hypothetical protein